MRKTCLLTFLFLLATLMNAADQVTITVSNPIPSARMEMVEVDVAVLQKKLQTGKDFVVTDAGGREIPSQVTHDQKLIFQVGVAGKGKSLYYVQKGTPQKYEVKAKGRLFTERQDEFGWENDCVAYRVYGHGGAVGYDFFNKSTPELMLDYWYASEQNQEMRFNGAKDLSSGDGKEKARINELSIRFQTRDHYSAEPQGGDGRKVRC